MKNIPFRVVIHEIYSYFCLVIDDVFGDKHCLSINDHFEENEYLNTNDMILSLYGRFTRDPSRTVWKLYSHMGMVRNYHYTRVFIYYPLDTLFLQINNGDALEDLNYFNHSFVRKITLMRGYRENEFNICLGKKYNNYVCIYISVNKREVILHCLDNKNI